jgi:hypothetical protein
MRFPHYIFYVIRIKQDARQQAPVGKATVAPYLAVGRPAAKGMANGHALIN